MKKFVAIESPFASTKTPGFQDAEVELQRNLAYVRAAMADCFARGEIPFASHALYTQPGVLDDTIPEERQKGIQAGFDIAEALDSCSPFVRAFYIDRGWSNGMVDGLEDAFAQGHARERRSLGSEWSKDNDALYRVDSRGQLHKVKDDED